MTNSHGLHAIKYRPKILFVVPLVLAVPPSLATTPTAAFLGVAIGLPRSIDRWTLRVPLLTWLCVGAMVTALAIWSLGRVTPVARVAVFYRAPGASLLAPPFHKTKFLLPERFR